MAELTNPLFEEEKEFLERQKLEYERAILGDVEGIKEKTQQVGKYAAIGAGLVGSIWLISKAFGGRKKKKHGEFDELPSSGSSRRALRKGHGIDADIFLGDDLGFGASQHDTYRGQPREFHERAHIAPDVYHATAQPDTDLEDPFQPVGPYALASVPHGGEEKSSLLSDTLRSFLQSDTGKVLVAQATAVLMAVVAKKLGEYLPMVKNPDLATTPAYEPETKDIDFTFHDDDANAPHQPL